MHKVMTRAQQRPATRPPARRDPRRPGGNAGARTPGSTTPRTTGTPTPRAPGGTAPPRTPGGGPARTPAADGRPPGSARTTGPRTRPTDTRPPTPSTTPTAPRRATRTTAPAPRNTTPVPAPRGTAPRVPGRHPHRPAPVPRLLPTDLFADLLLAVLSGHRPVHSMLRHTRGRAYDELAWLAERGPLRTRGARPVVRDIGYFEPRPGAIEAFARIGAGDRLRAMAFRLELGQDLRWRCTAVELGGPRPPRAEAD
ncbi:Rv3235 family protein [Streptomyces africanus]|uniref:Rv3235 family protein n=1 Tax=Streptomyces africanus TaxID=231024 RepID=UPI0027D8C694|nr:Rv3235 family protein [Streptomyces africanus]